MLHAMNQFGGGAMSPAERARAIRDETWQSPDGTQTRVFRYDSSAGKYLGEAPPPGWNVTDRAVPMVPGMGTPPQQGDWVTAYNPETKETVTVREGEYDPAVHGNITKDPTYKDLAGTGTGGAKDEREAAQVLTNIDQTLADINANPWTVSTFAPVRGFVGKFAGSAADELKQLGLDKPASALRSLAENSGATEVASMDFRLTNAVTDTARYIINKGDPRMSNYDVDAARDILNRDGVFKDSETTKAALMELRSIIAQVSGLSTPSGMGTAPPQESGPSPYAFEDAEKERRYQEWLKTQGAR
jgi:hypothetical protein